MANHEHDETVSDGVLGRVAGKVKAVVGAALGDDVLQREGNLQQASVEAARDAEEAAQAAEQADAEAELEARRAATEAERQQLRAEVAAAEAKARIERAEGAAQAAVDAEARRERQDVTRLREQARRAEQVADAIDPEKS